MKERIKSIALVALVFVNVILGSKILSSKKLWSNSGYNFFSVLQNPVVDFVRNIKNKLSDAEVAETHLEQPAMIIINTGYQTSRLALNRADEEFENLSPIIDEFLFAAFSKPQNFSEVAESEFYSALTAKSVYLHYPVSYDSTFFAYLLGIASADFSQSFSQLCNIVIAADGAVLVEDFATGGIYRCMTDVSTLQLNEIIDLHTQDNESGANVINYSFDLGFDKAFGTQKTIIAPMIPIYSSELELSFIHAKNPLLKSDLSLNEMEISNILQVFNMNPNILRRYTEADGTIVFVENNATLKISLNGAVNYSSTDGILLTKSNYMVQLDAVSAVADFVDKVNTAAGSNSAMQLSSPLTSSELSDEELEISLDYIANGMPVKLDDPIHKNAVTLTIENGRLKSYSQLLRSYTTTDTKTIVPNYILALDDAIAKYETQLNDIEINSMETVYIDNCIDDDIAPIWNVGVKDIVIAG